MLSDSSFFYFNLKTKFLSEKAISVSNRGARKLKDTPIRLEIIYFIEPSPLIIDWFIVHICERERRREKPSTQNSETKWPEGTIIHVREDSFAVFNYAELTTLLITGMLAFFSFYVVASSRSFASPSLRDFHGFCSFAVYTVFVVLRQQFILFVCRALFEYAF